jgi:hypothetical protein
MSAHSQLLSFAIRSHRSHHGTLESVNGTLSAAFFGWHAAMVRRWAACSLPSHGREGKPERKTGGHAAASGTSNK